MKGRSTPRSSPWPIPFPWPPPPLRPLAISGSNLPCARPIPFPWLRRGFVTNLSHARPTRGSPPLNPQASRHRLRTRLTTRRVSLQPWSRGARLRTRLTNRGFSLQPWRTGRQPWRERLQHWRSPPSPSTSSRPSRRATSHPPTCSLPGWETRRGSTSSSRWASPSCWPRAPASARAPRCTSRASTVRSTRPPSTSWPPRARHSRSPSRSTRPPRARGSWARGCACSPAPTRAWTS